MLHLLVNQRAYALQDPLAPGAGHAGPDSGQHSFALCVGRRNPMILSGYLSSFLQSLEVNAVQLVQHVRSLVGSPDIQGRSVVRRTPVGVGLSE